MTKGKKKFECPECHRETELPEWNPYDGFWECPACGGNLDIDGGPRDADFDYINQNPCL